MGTRHNRFIVSIPVFLDVALVILIPIVYSLAQKAKSNFILWYPLLAGLAVTHAFVPPTPGPITVAKMLGVDLGGYSIWYYSQYSCYDFSGPILEHL